MTLLTEESAVILEENLSRSTIGRIMKRNELRPYLNSYWCIPPKENADFVANMEDILDVYQLPYDPKYPVWCMDELRYELHAWNDAYNRNPSPINWQFKATDSRIKLKKLYPDIEVFISVYFVCKFQYTYDALS